MGKPGSCRFRRPWLRADQCDIETLVNLVEQVRDKIGAVEIFGKRAAVQNLCAQVQPDTI